MAKHSKLRYRNFPTTELVKKESDEDWLLEADRAEQDGDCGYAEAIRCGIKLSRQAETEEVVFWKVVFWKKGGEWCLRVRVLEGATYTHFVHHVALE